MAIMAAGEPSWANAAVVAAVEGGFTEVTASAYPKSRNDPIGAAITLASRTDAVLRIIDPRNLLKYLMATMA